jgi:hypothetical protein
MIMGMEDARKDPGRDDDGFAGGIRGIDDHFFSLFDVTLL